MNGIKKTSIGISIAFATLGGLAGREGLATRTSEKIRHQVATAVGKDSSDVFFKSSLLPKSDRNTYLAQVIDSATGGTSIPNTAFKTDSLIANDAAVFERKADSLMENANNDVKHADELRNFAQGLRRMVAKD